MHHYSPELLEALQFAGFRPEAYWDANADLHPHLHRDQPTELLRHFVEFGVAEQRFCAVDLDLTGLRSLRQVANGTDDPTFALQAMSLLVNNAVTDLDVTAQIDQHWALVEQLSTEFGAVPYVLIGDSHSISYRCIGVQGTSWLLPVHLNCTAGSALGLLNPASRSGYGPRIASFAEAFYTLSGSEIIPMLWKFGQVDAEFVHIYKRAEQGEVEFSFPAFESFAKRSVEAFAGFLTQVIPHHRRASSVVVSVFPPALADATWSHGYANAHVSVLESTLSYDELVSRVQGLEIASLPVRTAMHRRYDELLKDATASIGVSFADDFDQFLGADGLVDPRFVQDHGRNHHLTVAASRAVAESSIWRLMRRGP